MEMLHDPTIKMFIVEGWVEPEEFLSEIRGYGVLTDREYVSFGYAIKDGYRYRLLKKPREEYTDLGEEPVEVMYYRY